MLHKLSYKYSANSTKARHSLLALPFISVAMLIWSMAPQTLAKTTQVAPGTGTLNEAVAAADPHDILQLEAGEYVTA